ncbi:hypothetical protein [Klebsiella quasipneumoniae]|uniref:hypothetical protein n=1 Tax=Klebsiella quasipneumoniae TaxID=1463165 RepID=UPI00164B8FAB|nr:hypothetical protein [Klebsiella quasipneumoniae]MBC5080702.1 hypothetical protein [Klebsiella quasipneumoniae]MBC5185058.1 hypothetical protein [Klebsiella quasipneumoniae]
MTITLQAVNELIASLESAGEPSIREEKFLKLAKAFKQLAAENSYLMHRIEWPKQQCPTTGDVTDVEPADFIPATDRIVAGIKADGVEEFAESQKEYVRQHRNEMDQVLRAAYAGSAVDAERFAKQLREGADK